MPKSGARGSSALCDICHCTRPNAEVALYVAPKAGAAGKNGNSIGTYICADLACSLNARGLRTLELTQPEPPGETKVAGVRRRFEAFIAQVRMP